MSIAILFPGQGSQERGMGQDVAESVSEAMDLWKLAESESGLPLREIYWDGEAKDMAQTRSLQPALTVTNLSLWVHGASRKFKADATAGHSLGEFSALGAAGVLSLEDTVRATILRGRLMSEVAAEDQGMAAIVKLPRDAVEVIVEQAAKSTGKSLVVANYNSPAQFVISGEKDALDAAADMAKENKGRAIPLAVSGAFHSPLINEAATEFAGFLRGLKWNQPRIPVYFNSTASTEKSADVIMEIMCKQMISSVRWIDISTNIYDAGIREFVEVGPKNVLTKLTQANTKAKGEAEFNNISSLEDLG